MKNDTKLTKIPENYTVASTRFADLAAGHAEIIWGSDGLAITDMFRPADVARIVAEELAPQLMMQVEIAQLERDIAELKLARALAKIAELENR